MVIWPTSDSRMPMIPLFYLEYAQQWHNSKRLPEAMVLTCLHDCSDAIPYSHWADHITTPIIAKTRPELTFRWGSQESFLLTTDDIKDN
jgi:hypothetical protein